ncbi:hypothetical protein AB0B45_26425 [Nonomuraea sp. NPDC049152]
MQRESGKHGPRLDDFVVEAVSRLPRGGTFTDIAEVAEALGLGIERKRW